MAEVLKSGKPSLSSLNPAADNRIIGQAGEDIAAGDWCRLNSSGVIVLSNGAAADNAANCHGMADRDVVAGNDITIFRDVRFHYGKNLTPGASLYLSGTVPGGMADAPSLGGDTPCAFVMKDGARVQLVQSILR